MAVDLSTLDALQAGITRKVTLNATGGNVTAITFPRWCRRVTFSFFTSAGAAEVGYFEMSGTDGAAKTVNAFYVGSSGAYTRKIAPDGIDSPAEAVVLYLAGTSASGYVLIDLEP
jgi:hypothetical protein